MYSQDYDRSSLLVFYFEKSAVFVCMGCNQLGFLAFRTTKVKDPKLTVAVILFYVGQNNSSNFVALQTYDKKVVEFPFLLRYTIPW